VTLEELIKQRDEFLERNPEMKEYQKEIDRLLENSPDRLKTIAFLLEQKVLEMQNACESLKDYLDKIDEK
jgi:hypothetical protein